MLAFKFGTVSTDFSPFSSTFSSSSSSSSSSSHFLLTTGMLRAGSRGQASRGRGAGVHHAQDGAGGSLRLLLRRPARALPRPPISREPLRGAGGRSAKRRKGDGCRSKCSQRRPKRTRNRKQGEEPPLAFGPLLIALLGEVLARTALHPLAGKAPFWSLTGFRP